MRTINKTKPIFVLFLPFLFFPFFWKDYNSVSYFNHGIFLLFVFSLIAISPDRKRFFLSPACITALYLYISFLLGDLLFKNQIYLDYRQYNYYEAWSHHKLASFYLNVSTYICLLTYFICPKDKSIILLKNKFPSSKKKLFQIVIIFILCLATIVYAGESISNIAVSLAGVFSVSLIYTIKKTIKNPFRFICYILVIISFAVADPDDKRNSIFLLYVIGIIEVFDIRSIKIKHMFYGLLAALFLFLSIVSMSIIRSTEGKFTLLGIAEQIPEYITSDAAQALISNNFELDYTYIDAFQPIEFIENNPSLLAYGSSYIKPLFLVIPRTVFPDKPESAMNQYTKVYDYSAAMDGYCLPMCIATEAYWNFRYAGIIAVFIIYYLLNLLYCSGLNVLYSGRHADSSNVLFLFMMYLTFMLIRGSGFDIFTLQFLIGVFAIRFS